jgi:hypothetical protein
MSTAKAEHCIGKIMETQSALSKWKPLFAVI